MVDMETMPRAATANYAVWTPDSQITLTNVPWDNNYRDVVRFAGTTEAAQHAALNRYIDSQSQVNTAIVDSSYARVDRPIRLQVPFTDAYGFNYIRVLNPTQGASGNGAMFFYYFITGIEYVNPGVTLFMVQLDIWQTFGARVKIGNSYIETGHIGIANSKSFQNNGRDYLTLPEGLDTGSEHQTIKDVRFNMVTPELSSVMVISNIDLTQDPGNIDDPGIKTSQGTKILGAPSGADVYFFTPDNFQRFVKAYQDYPWILQGIMSIMSVPSPESAGYKINKVVAKQDGSISFGVIDPTERGRGQDYKALIKWRDSTQISSQIPARYRGLKKFFTFPYMSIEVTSFSGAPIVLKPEQWNDPDGAFTIKTNYVAPGQRMLVYPRRYNAVTGAPERQETYGGRIEHFEDGGDYLEMSMSIGNFPSYALVNNSGVLAIANQAHSLAQQYKTNDWSQQKALQGNSVGYDQASASIGNTQQQGLLSRNAAINTAQVANDQAIGRGILGAATGAAHGALGGAMGGGVGAGVGAGIGIASGAAGVALDVQQRNANLAISNSAAYGSQLSNTNTAAYMRDTNKSLADWAARGDYQNSLAQINAKVQDTAMTPPFTAGQAGGETFNFVFGGIIMLIRWKMLPPAELAAIGEHWLRYGYAVRKFLKPPADLHVMTKFTYWKMLETYVTGTNIPEGLKQAFRGILEKGVTVWVDPNDIGNIDMADNKPKTGISF